MADRTPSLTKIVANPRPVRKSAALPKGEPLFDIPSDLMTLEEVAELLRMEVRGVRAWAELRRIDHYRTPTGCIRFRRKDVAGAMCLIPAIKFEPKRRGSGS